MPLAIGLGCLVLFAITHAPDIALIGFLTLYAGAALFFIGMICLVVFWCLVRACAPDERRRWSRRSAILLALLILNFPIAAGCAWLGLTLLGDFD